MTATRTSQARPGPHRSVLRTVVALLAVVLANAVTLSLPASADPTLTVSPTIAANTGPVTLTITTANPHIPGNTQVRLHGPAPASPDSYLDVSPAVSGMTVTARINLAPAGVPAGPGNYIVEVCDVQCDDNGLVPTETFSPFKIAGTPPTAGAVAPGAIGTGAANFKVEITGNDFSKSATVTFSIPGAKDAGGVTASATTVSSSNIVAMVSSTAAAAPGPRDVTVTSTDNQVTTVSQGLIVNAAPAGLAAIPNSVGQGAVKFPVLLTGHSFADGAVVTVQPGAGPTGDATIDPATGTSPDGGVTIDQGLHGSTNIPLTVSVAAGAPTGGRQLVVANPDGGKAAVPVTVNPAPTFANSDPTNPVTSAPSVSPGQRGQGSPGTTVSVFGAGFRPGATVDFGPGVTTGPVSVSSDGQTVTVTGVRVGPTAPAGGRDVLVVNGDGGRATCTSCFAVTAAPTVTSTRPASLGRGAASQFIQFAGTGFTSGMAVAIRDLSVNKVTVVSATAASVSVSVPAAVATGVKAITAKNTDGGSTSCAECLSVDSFQVTKTSPESSTNLRPVTLTVTGAKIPAGAVGSLVLGQQVPGQDTITATGSRVSTNGTTYAGTFDLTGAAPGDYLLRLSDPTGTGTCSCTYTVVGGQPSITQATPAVLSQGSSGVEVTLAGTNLARGATLAFPSGSGVAVDQARTTVVSSGRIDTVLNVAPNATMGPLQVSVTNTDKKGASCSACLSVKQGPTITSVAPDKLRQGANKQTVTVTGKNLPSQVQLDFGSGVTVEGSPQVNGATVTAIVDVASSASAGPRTVVLSGAYGSSASCGSCLTVVAALTTPGLFFALPPTRLLDTRASKTPVKAGADRLLNVAGTGGVPEDATAVVLNVTVIGPQAVGFLTVYPQGTTTATSNLNFVRGQNIANAVTVKLGSGGGVMLGVSSASTHVVVDVFGYYRQADSGDTFSPVQPARLLDTRTNHQRLGAGAERQLRVTGQGGVPLDADAVALNVTVALPSAAGHLMVYPAGTPTATWNLYFPARVTVPHLIVVKLGDQGAVALSLSNGSADVVVDVFGYYSPGPAGSAFTAVTPMRVLDTQASSAPLRAGQTRAVSIAGQDGVPQDADAVILNVTATRPASEGHLTVFPNGQMTDISNLNFVAGQTLPNLVVVRLSPDGDLAMTTSATSTDVVIDVFGYYRLAS